MPIEAKRKTRAGGGGKLDLGGIMQAAMPDKGVDVQQDPTTGKPTAKSNNGGFREFLHGGSSQSAADKLNSEAAMRDYESRLQLGNRKSEIDYGAERKLKDQSALDAFEIDKHGKLSSIDVDKAKDINSIHKFNVKFDELTPEQQDLISRQTTADLIAGIQHHEMLTSKEKRLQIGEEALQPNEAISAKAKQDSDTSDYLANTEKQNQMRGIMIKDPSIVGGQMMKGASTEIPPGGFNLNQYSGRYIQAPYSEEVPTTKRIPDPKSPGGFIEMEGKPIRRMQPFTSGVASPSSLAIQQAIGQQKQLEEQQQGRRDVVTPKAITIPQNTNTESNPISNPVGSYYKNYGQTEDVWGAMPDKDIGNTLSIKSGAAVPAEQTNTELLRRISILRRILGNDQLLMR